MKKHSLPLRRYILLRAKSFVPPALFLVVMSFIGVETYRYALRADGSPLPLFVILTVLTCLIVFTYVVNELRSEYWHVRDFFEDERTGYVRRSADALRTPLTGVRWLSEMLMEGEMGELNAEQKDSMQKIHVATRRLLAQTDELLKVAKICGGLIQYRPNTANFAETVQEAARKIHPFAESKTQTIDVSTQGDAPMFRFDRKLILHILEVLLMNAAHLAPQNGTISIAVRSDRGMILADIASAPVASGTPHPARRIGAAPGLDKAQREEYSDDVSMAVTFEIINAAKGELWVAQTGDIVTYTVALPTSFPSTPVV